MLSIQKKTHKRVAEVTTRITITLVLFNVFLSLVFANGVRVPG